MFQPGIFGQLAGGTFTETIAEEISLKQTLLGIFPNNLFGAFVNNDILQIVILAAVLGVATTLLGQRAEAVNNFFECGNTLFLKATELITKYIPIMVFCSVVSLISDIDGETALFLLSFLGTNLTAMIGMVSFFLLRK